MSHFIDYELEALNIPDEAIILNKKLNLSDKEKNFFSKRNQKSPLL